MRALVLGLLSSVAISASAMAVPASVQPAGGLLSSNNLSDVANKGTARVNLGSAASGANSDITSLTGLITPLPAGEGGTGAATAAANMVFAGPSSGSAAAPSYRALVTTDIPSLSAAYCALTGCTLIGALMANSLSTPTSGAGTNNIYGGTNFFNSTYFKGTVNQFNSAITGNGGMNTTGTITGYSLTSTNGMVVQPAAPGITLAAITAPASGAAPTGATQLTAASGRITSCPTNSAAQTTVSTGQSQSYVNACGASFMLYPVAGGTLGAQTANTPLMIDTGMTFTLTGLSATAANIDVHMNFQWTDVSQPFTVPAMAAQTCSPPINITESKAMVGDKVTPTGNSAIPTDNIPVSFEISVPSNGTLQLKACNIANTGLANSTAISGATLNLLGTGSR